MIVDFVKSEVTGGHFGFVDNQNQVFTNKMTEAKLVSLKPDDIVVDIGAYVGEYSLYALNQNVKEVHAYEASPITCEVLRTNAISPIKVYNRAVIGTDDEITKLYLGHGIGVTNSVFDCPKKQGAIYVPAIKFNKAIENATVVKIDVEGAEYTYNFEDAVRQPNIRAFIIEFHSQSINGWREKAENIIAIINSAGYKPLYQPNFSNDWDFNATWIKE